MSRVLRLGWVFGPDLLFIAALLRDALYDIECGTSVSAWSVLVYSVWAGLNTRSHTLSYALTLAGLVAAQVREV